MTKKKEPVQAELTPAPQDDGALIEIAEQGLAVPEVFDPIAVIERAEEVVGYVQAKIDANPALRKKFITDIKGKDYATVEWWSAIAAPFGLIAIIVPRNPGEPLVRRVDAQYGDVETHEATAELYDRAGNVVGRAEMICSAAETRWGHSDSYARKSMAQTRARGKAYRNSALSFLAVLAGLEATPAAEVPPGGFGKANPAAPPANRYDAFYAAWDKVMAQVDGSDDKDTNDAMRHAYVYASTTGQRGKEGTSSLTGVTDAELAKLVAGLRNKNKKKAVEWFVSGNWRISADAAGPVRDETRPESSAGPTCHTCGKALTSGEADACAMMQTEHPYCKEHVGLNAERG